MDNQSFNPAANAAPSVTPMAGPNPYQQPTQPIAPGAAAPSAKTPIQKAKTQRLIMLIAVIVTSLMAATFLGLFAWMYVMWDEAKTDVDGQVEKAVAIAVNEKQTELENEFIEREKLPFKTFAGPIDYGSLTFKFPKTWSVYVPDSANYGGDYRAFLNPDLVSVVSDGTINALRVSILGALADTIIADYQDAVEDGEMTVSVYKVNGANASLYSGILPDTDELRGHVAIFKIRDKTVLMQTDAEIFKDDFLKILDTVRYNV